MKRKTKGITDMNMLLLSLQNSLNVFASILLLINAVDAFQKGSLKWSAFFALMASFLITCVINNVVVEIKKEK